MTHQRVILIVVPVADDSYLLSAYCLVPSGLSVRVISSTMRLTSGGSARPFRSFSAGTARMADGFCATATGELAAPAATTPDGLFSAAAAFFSAAGAARLAGGLTGCAFNSS